MNEKMGRGIKTKLPKTSAVASAFARREPHNSRMIETGRVDSECFSYLKNGLVYSKYFLRSEPHLIDIMTKKWLRGSSFTSE